MGRGADRIHLTNDIGGNIGSAFRNAIDLALRQGDQIVFVAVLHHDDCVAERAGLRSLLQTSRSEVSAFITNRGVNAPVFTGTIVTESNAVRWSDEPVRSFETFRFRMPRLSP
jgi:hypothetical protein